MKAVLAWATVAILYAVLTYVTVDYYEREVIVPKMEQRVFDME